MKKTTLITGFLGAGKTTFLKKYATFCLQQNKRIGIIENDFGAVNVDMMLIKDLEQENCALEMVSGGCDQDCHRRRFKTKLIALGMQPFDEIIVEPSGIYDMDEFFDVLRDEPLDNWYEIGNVLAVVDANIVQEPLSGQAKYILVTQIAAAGMVIISKLLPGQSAENVIHYCNTLLSEFGLPALEGIQVLAKPFSEFTDKDMQMLCCAGYKIPSIPKQDFALQDAFESVYLLDKEFDKASLEDFINKLFKASDFGTISRVKGFFQEKTGAWCECNATTTGIEFKPIAEGQKVVLIIGEGLDKKAIEALI